MKFALGWVWVLFGSYTHPGLANRFNWIMQALERSEQSSPRAKLPHAWTRVEVREQGLRRTLNAAILAFHQRHQPKADIRTLFTISVLPYKPFRSRSKHILFLCNRAAINRAPPVTVKLVNMAVLTLCKTDIVEVDFVFWVLWSGRLALESCFVVERL
jgi:hypothetical protein